MKDSKETTKEYEIRKSKQYLGWEKNNLPGLIASKHMNSFIKSIGQKYWSYDKNKIINNPDKELSVSISKNELLKNSDNTNLWNDAELIKTLDQTSKFVAYFDNEIIKTWLPIFQKVEINQITGQVDVIFNKQYVNHLLEIKQDFVSLNMFVMKEFKSKHSFSLYEQFKSKGNGKMWKFNKIRGQVVVIFDNFIVKKIFLL